MTDPTPRFQAAIAAFDAANAQDPHRETHDGQQWPRELLYAQRMTIWLQRLAPDAGEPLRLAARAQHIRRWEIPREQYPEGRAGYHQWRTRLYGFHAQMAAAILTELGYDPATIARVSDLLHKRHIKADPDMQLLEDVICLVFLESYFAEFAQKHEPQKMIPIIRRTWQKMSARGHAAALQLPLSPESRRLVEAALEGSGE